MDDDASPKMDDSQEGHAAGPASAAPEPAAPFVAPVFDGEGYSLPDDTAAPEAYSRDYAEGRARGLAEAAQMIDEDRGRTAYYYLAERIRAKIKPAKGEL